MAVILIYRHRYITRDDLYQLDSEIYNSTQNFLYLEEDQVEDMCLTFGMTLTHSRARTHTLSFSLTHLNYSYFHRYRGSNW